MTGVTKFETESFVIDLGNLIESARGSRGWNDIHSDVKPLIIDEFVARWNSSTYTVPLAVRLDYTNHKLSIYLRNHFTDDLQYRVSVRSSKDDHVTWLHPDAGINQVVMTPCVALGYTYRDNDKEYLKFRLEISAVNAERCFVMSQLFGRRVCAGCTGKTDFALSLAESVKKYADNSGKFAGEQFQHDDDTDLLIKSGDAELWVHGDIVCGQSEVLKEMFEVVDMVEKETKTAEIPNFEPEVVKTFLEIVYARSKMMKIMKDPGFDNLIHLCFSEIDT